jgi:hypothetical protein
VDFYGNYSFRYLWQKRLHFWSYSHHPFYLQRGALSIKHDLQTRPSKKTRAIFVSLGAKLAQVQILRGGGDPWSPWSGQRSDERGFVVGVIADAAKMAFR